MVAVDVEDVTTLGLIVAETPVGNPSAESATDPTKLPVRAMVALTDRDPPAVSTTTVSESDTVNPPAGAVDAPPSPLLPPHAVIDAQVAKSSTP